MHARPPRKRAADLIELVMGTVRKGGNVLLPCDTAGRVLELLLLLDHHWTRNRLGTYPLVLLHRSVSSVCAQALLAAWRVLVAVSMCTAAAACACC
jgi:Cft2 family RNA processing exonuclease